MTPLLTAERVEVPGRVGATSLALAAGSLTALIGPNGSGKTSLLRALAAIEPVAGEVHVAGELLARAPPARRRSLMSFLPASREVSWPISVRNVIALGLARPEPARVAELLDLLALSPLAERTVDRLSTGERARSLLARALSPRPQVLLLDEPLSNLDPYWVLRTLEIVRQATRDGAAALVSLHDLALLPHFDRVLLMDGGRLVADAAGTDVLADPAFARAFRVKAGAGGWEMVR